jgi:hypothetical protein
MEYRDYVRRGCGVHLNKRVRDKLASEPDCLRSGGGAREGLLQLVRVEVW